MAADQLVGLIPRLSQDPQDTGEQDQLWVIRELQEAVCRDSIPLIWMKAEIRSDLLEESGW